MRELLPRIKAIEDRLLRVGPAGDKPFRLAAVAAARTAAEPDDALFCAHSGSSMNPTLSARDLLEIVPYTGSSPQAGDVVLFVRPDGEELVVHRIVRVIHERVRTRGDSNATHDPYTVTQQDLIGQVVAAWRGRKRRPIRGGLLGLARARGVRWLRAADMAVCRVLHPLYRVLAGSALLRCLIPARLRPRVVSFTVDGHKHLRLLAGRRVVGRYDPQRKEWRIRRPYRILVDEAALPAVPSSATIPSRSRMHASVAPSDREAAPPAPR